VSGPSQRGAAVASQDGALRYSQHRLSHGVADSFAAVTLVGLGFVHVLMYW
jgi:hypothetical protein